MYKLSFHQYEESTLKPRTGFESAKKGGDEAAGTALASGMGHAGELTAGVICGIGE
ncbi:hypothetical protein HNR39_001480 [Glaciimonas immobilis]|uniref:Uncharacterized protein n=1 Tax=Glaciimonas immobilis TaxID=728004 RepID=A0A840RRN3_9BURK|nr:hypothetical protein [Glaciimonas immobilis]